MILTAYISQNITGAPLGADALNSGRYFCSPNIRNNVRKRDSNNNK